MIVDKTLRKLLISLSFLSLTGCVSVDSMYKFIPSFWDDNQSAAITNVRTSIAYIDCNKPQLEQAKQITTKATALANKQVNLEKAKQDKQEAAAKQANQQQLLNKLNRYFFKCVLNNFFGIIKLYFVLKSFLHSLYLIA
mgnify:CR=1 FL=1